MNLTRRLWVIVCVWLGFSIFGNSQVSTAVACPVVFQEESDSLVDLLVKYNTRLFVLSQDHPEAIALRSEIEARIGRGEKIDRKKLATMLQNFRQQFPSTRNKLVVSHPKAVATVSNIVLLSELLALETEDSPKLLDAILEVKDDWVSGVLYVPGGRFIGYADDLKPEDTQFAISKGSDDGLKVGMHLHVYAKPGEPVTRSTPIGKTFVLGRVASVEPKRAQIQLSSHPNNPLPTKIFCTQPGFNIGSLVITVRFDEEAWKNRPLMNAFLGDLLHNCSGEERAKLNVLVTDTPRSECQIDLLPTNSNGHTEDQLRTLKALDSYVKEQPYFTNMKLNSVTSPLANPTKVHQNEYMLQILRDENLARVQRWSESPLLRRRDQALNIHSAFSNWQDSELQRIHPDALPEVISGLRTKANELESASIEKANDARRMLVANPPKTAEEIEKVKTELRASVDEAFNARHQLQIMEFTSLTIQVQTTLQNLNERAESQTAIVDRRVDDLLNPNYRWDSTTKMLPAGDPEIGLQASKNLPLPSSVTGQVTVRGKPIAGKIGFNPTGGLPILETIDQAGKFQTNALQPGKYKVAIYADSEIAAKIISSKYKDPLTTPIEIEVLSRKNEFQFFDFEVGK